MPSWTSNVQVENMKNSDCVFCKIINKEIPAEIVYEDNDFLAFKTIEPVSTGHTLVIPKKHAENVLDIEQVTLEKLSGVAQKVAKDLVKRHSATGINLLHAAGKNAQQSVFHFHMHVVPRYENDNLDLWFKNKL